MSEVSARALIPACSSAFLCRLAGFIQGTLLSALMVLAVAPVSLAQSPIDVTTWRYDTTHAGQNTAETTLTPSNVASGTFGKLFSQAVDGYVYAQPLYVNGITMNDGLVHNVLIVATEHDSLYAFDADTNGGANAQPIWQVSLLEPDHGAATGATTIPSTDLGTKDLVPEIGVTGTPVINRATNTIYVVSATKENGTYFQRLHAINLTTGAEQTNSPVVIKASVAGTGMGSSGGTLVFSPLWQMNRGALDLYKGYVYIAYGSHGDNGPWHGWIFAYDATKLTQTGVICTSPNGYGNGIWGAGAGLPIDTGGTAGRLYFSTGNGTYSAYPPFNGSASYGDSIVQVSLANGSLTPTDAFTPFNQDSLSTSDLDQGSGGVLMLPDQQGSHPHILIQVGKEGRILVLNRDDLGGYAPGGTSNTNALQDINGQVRGLWSTPAYWNGNAYFWGSSDYAKSFQLTNGQLSATYSSHSPALSGFPGPSMVISANGTQSGIAWAARTDSFGSNGSEVLFAFDATDLSRQLYASTSNARDDAGPATKFVVPVIANGKVYLGAAYQVDVYGLLNGQATTAAPVISPSGGTFTGTENVTLTSATHSASIYYTTDGSVPTTGSTLYAGPISVTADTTIRAIASASGYLQSSVSSASFILNSQVPPVTIAPSAGTYSTPQSVVLSDIDATAKIHYTLDGSAPTASSPLYTAPIAVGSSLTIKAIAVDPSLTTNSNVVTASYVIQAGGSTINFGSGFSVVTGLTLNGTTKNTDDSRLQLTDGGFNEAGSVFYTQKVNIDAFTSDFSFQLSSAKGDGFTFAIQNAAPTALGHNGGSLGYGSSTATGGIPTSVAIKFDFYSNAGEGTNTTGVFTNGAYPTTPAINLTPSGIQLSSGDSIQAHVTYDGTTLTMVLTDVIVNKTFTMSKVIDIPGTVGSDSAYVGFTGGTGGSSASQKILSWTYASQIVAKSTAAPTFAPAGGTFATPQTVTLSDATSGAVIHYTTDGTAPTTSSPVYSKPIPVTYGTTAVEALALASGYTASAINSATYVVSEPTSAPVISPVGGTYATAQIVTIGDGDASAVVHYTTDGSQPTASSPVYAGPISISTSRTIKAIAVDPALQNSSVTSASYVISTTSAVAPAPIISPAGGTYSAAQTVTIADSDSSAVIHYTTDGTQPSASSPIYASSISVVSSQTIKAIALDPALQNSSITSASYVISTGTSSSSINYASGFASASGLTLNGKATVDSNVLTLTNGQLNLASSVFANTPVNIRSFTSDFSFQVSSAKGDGFTFVIQNAGRTAVGHNGASLGYGSSTATGGIPTSVAIKFDFYSNAGEGTNTTGVFTNGANPTVPAIDITPSGIQLSSGDAIQAHVTYDGTTLTMVLTDAIVNKTFTMSKVIDIPGTVGSDTAYVGFTGGTGGSTAVQKILSWTFGPPSIASPSIDYASGFATASGLTLNGKATVGSNVLALTNGQLNLASSAFPNTPVNIQAFTTTFNFQLLNAVADGFTFTIQNAGAKALGHNGSGLGYGAVPGITPSVAIKFDLHSNAGEGSDSTGLYTNGATPTLPASDLTASGIQLSSGHTMQAQLSYNGTTLTLLLTDTVTNKTYTQSFTVNIPEVVGGSTAYVGFTAGTGGASATQNILSWTFTSTAAGTTSNMAASAGTSTRAVSSEAEMSQLALVTGSSDVSKTAKAATSPVAEVVSTSARSSSATSPGSSRSGLAASEPQLAPFPGALEQGGQVRILSADPRAVIHYTTDGSQPTTGSLVYHSAIVISGTALTLKAFSSVPGEKDSPVVTGTYHVRE